jgi:hypothetical protein
LVDVLDLSLDEAEKIIGAAKAIVEARNAQAGAGASGDEAAAETIETSGETMRTAETSDEAPEAETQTKIQTSKMPKPLQKSRKAFYKPPTASRRMKL